MFNMMRHTRRSTLQCLGWSGGAQNQNSRRSRETRRCNGNGDDISLLPLCDGCLLWIMASYHILRWIDKCYGNAMRVLLCVISNYRMKHISHTAGILSTSFFQSSSPPLPLQPLPLPSPPLPSPPSGILLLDFFRHGLYVTHPGPLSAKPDPL